MVSVGRQARSCTSPCGEFRAWLVLGRFPSEFRANSERTPSSEQIPGKFRASIPNPLFPCHSVQQISLVSWHTSPWAEIDHAQNLACLGNGRNTVSRVLFRRRELTEPHWVLGQTRWVLRKTRWVRFGTQIVGWVELTELAPRNSVSPEKLTDFGVWNRAPRNRIRLGHPLPRVAAVKELYLVQCGKCRGFFVKFLADIFDGYWRTKIGKFFRQIFTAFFRPSLAQISPELRSGGNWPKYSARFRMSPCCYAMCLIVPLSPLVPEALCGGRLGWQQHQGTPRLVSK